MKHVIFLVGSYYPYYSAVGKCIGNIASVFENTYRVTVICEKNTVNQSDEDILNKQDILRVTTRMHYNRIKIDEKVMNAHGGSKLFWKTFLILSKCERFLKIAFSKSACDYSVVNAYVDGLSKIKGPIDVIIPTCNQFETVLAAMRYRQCNPKTQIIPYLFDLFAESININRGKLLLRMHWKSNMKYERQMFEESSCVFHVANWTKHIEHYFPEYKNKAVEVEHPLLVNRDNKVVSNKDGYIHIVYTGVVDLAVRNPEKCLNVLYQLKDNGFRFDFYSYGSAEKIVRRMSERCSMIVAHGKVASNEAECARQRANILLSIGNKGNISQIPSKLIEYISSGKPIIHFSQGEDDPSISLLSLYPVAKVINLSQHVDYNDLRKFIRDNSNRVLDFNEIKRIFQQADPDYISKLISDKFIGGGARVVFAGSLKRGYVDAQYVVDLFSCDLFRKCSIEFYSAGNGVDVVRKAMPNISLKGWIDKATLEKVYDEADAFLSIAEKNGKQISSKIFEYMAYGKPIIHIYYADNDINIKYLNHYPKALCIKALHNDISFQRKELALFLLCMKTHDMSNEIDSELRECTPEVIAQRIALKICK